MLSNRGAEEDFESSINWKEIKPVNPKGNQFWIFIGSTDAEAEAPILWPSDAKSWFIGKDSDTQKDWRQGEKGTTEDVMVGRHHRFNGHEFEQTLGVSERQGSLECCSPWGHKELDMTEQLNNNKKVIICIFWNSPRISYFSNDSWYLSLENGIKNQDLGLPWYLNGLKKKRNLPANAGDVASIPDLGRSHIPWSNYAHAAQLLSPVLQSPRAATTEARVA